MTTRFDEPFPHWILDGQAPAHEATAEVQRSARSPGLWKCYDNPLERKRLVDSPRSIGPGCAAVCRFEWNEHIAQQAGLPCRNLKRDPSGYGGAIHAMLPGDYLSVHLDRALLPNVNPPLELRLAVVVFLVPEWRDEWGGSLDFCDPLGHVVASVFPRPDRVVIWEPSDLSYHGVSRVSDDCPVVRGTANCFYYAHARTTATRRRALFVPNREHEKAVAHAG